MWWRWTRAPFAFVGDCLTPRPALSSTADALPRHLLADAFSTVEQTPATRDVFAGLTFWSTEYVGLGPYRLDRWEPGSQIEGVAFAGHALGRPKIERIVIRIMGDENTVLSSMLSENTHVATDVTLRYEHAAVLNREWERNRKGLVILTLGLRHYSYIQFRPEYLKTPALLDVRVRRAVAHSLDKAALNEGFFEGQAPIDHSFVSPTARYFAELDRTVMKYPYDPRRTEQLLNEAGFTKDREGFFADAGGARFRPELWTEQNPLWEKELALMIDLFVRSGIDVQPYVLPNRLVRDNEARATIPGIYTVSTTADERRLEIFTSRQIGSPANRWGGGNRGGWSNADVDRLWDAFLTTLDRSERDRQIMQITRLVSEQVPAIPLYFNPGVIAHLAVVRGPTNETPETLAAWNIHEWEITG
jgi:peptide/nickel transport system substrate-binding protein